MMEKEGGLRALKKPLAVLARYKYVLAVAALGVVLLLWPGSAGRASPEGGGDAAESVSVSTALRETEQAMEEILSRIEGVGRVDVMLTLRSGGELILAEDTTLRYSGSVQSPDDYQRSSEVVTADGGVVVRQEKYPEYRGALVVCDGGGSDTVRLRVIAAVSALTGLGADKIAVVPWGSSAGNGAS